MGRAEGVKWCRISSGPSNPLNGTLCPSLGRGQDLTLETLTWCFMATREGFGPPFVLALSKLPYGGTPPIVVPHATTTTAPPPTTTTAPPPTTTTRPPPPPITTAPSPGQEASFSCTGSAPEGVDITYGTDTSNLSGGSPVPWQATLALPSTVEYADVCAQLQGPDGTITCTTTVTWTQDGRSHSVTQTGTASGDYNIASAEVCSGFSGGFETC
jgi:hypothetical protein